MARRIISFLLAALAILVLAAPVRAQTTPYVYFGGGASIPMGDYADYANTGWLVNGGIGTSFGDKGLWADIGLLYGTNNHSDVTGDKTNLFIGMVNLGYTFDPDAKMSPYVVGSVGTLSHQYKSDQFPSLEGSESMLVYSGGAGLIWKRGEKSSFWVEARYMTGSKDGSATSFVPLLVGMTINLK
jgi:hypothetical protein